MSSLLVDTGDSWEHRG